MVTIGRGVPYYEAEERRSTGVSWCSGGFMGRWRRERNASLADTLRREIEHGIAQKRRGSYL